MEIPSENELTLALEMASEKAILELFGRGEENFYYCSLITSGEAHPPVLSAWSHEALELACLKKSDPAAASRVLKWSYADSPYFNYRESYFSDVRRLISMRPPIVFDMPMDLWEAEYGLRLRAIEKALASLDAKGIFGFGVERLKIVVNVEVMPPDKSNVERALRLNPQAALSEWLVEAAENHRSE